jgi:hypothetical protein
MAAQELSEASRYLAGAFGVFLALLLVYVAIMATKLSRMERELTELAELAERGAVERERERQLEADDRTERERV